MAQIVVLDQHTAELIAAGEVVERPASVVKELCENAIDAGASRIFVSIERGGVACIEIEDDGTGIEAEYIPTAFIRHATSKIRTGEDLEHICTLGFRGEALASVASVAHVELLTKTKQDEFASLYRISGGAEESFEAAARPVGTTVTVRDLFYNTPARMKFLKKDASEGNYVSDVVTELALSHPAISFRFTREKKRQFQTPGDGSLRGAAYAALSSEFARDLLEVDYTAGACAVRGCITPPKSARGSRGMQFFFVNGRYVKNRTMMAALEAAYKGMMMQGRYPGGILNFTLPPELVDVNVHPAKTEVRFSRERDVFDLVYAAAKNVLLMPGSGERELSFAQQKSAEPSARAALTHQSTAFPAPQKASAQSGGYAGTAASTASQVRVYNATVRTLASAPAAVYETRTQRRAAAAPEAAPCALEAKPAGAEAEKPKAPLGALEQGAALSGQKPCAQERFSDALPEEKTALLGALEPGQKNDAPAQQTVLAGCECKGPEALRYVGEVFRTYIIAQRGAELCLIDKHAAHERVLYEKLAAAYGGAAGQLLLCPVTVQVSAAEKDALLQNAALLEQSGIAVEDFGGGAVVVRSVPADVVPQDVENLLLELAARLVHNPHDSLSEKTEWVLHSIACRAAVKAGNQTGAPELMRLAQQVLDGEIPPFCPHGRPVVLKITQKELEKQFGRLG